MRSLLARWSVTDTPSLPDQSESCARSEPTPPPAIRPDSAFGAAAARVASEPEQLTLMFFGFQGCPDKLNSEQTFNAWTAEFKRLIREYGFLDLQGAMRWAFEVDGFWPPHLMRTKRQIEYFEEKLSSLIMAQYLGWKTGRDNAATKKGSSTYGKSNFKSTRERQPYDYQAAADEAKRLAREFREREVRA